MFRDMASAILFIWEWLNIWDLPRHCNSCRENANEPVEHWGSQTHMFLHRWSTNIIRHVRWGCEKIGYLSKKSIDVSDIIILPIVRRLCIGVFPRIYRNYNMSRCSISRARLCWDDEPCLYYKPRELGSVIGLSFYCQWGHTSPVVPVVY